MIPLNYNDGSEVPISERHEILDRLFALGQGYTLAATVTGAFRAKDGSKQVDRSAEIWIALDEDQEPELKKLVAEICRRLQQEAIYLERTGGTIEFIPPSDPGAER